MRESVGTYFLAASRLREAGININYGYCGPRPATVPQLEEILSAPKVGHKKLRESVNRTSLDSESSKKVGTGTPVPEESKLAKLHKTRELVRMA